MKAEHRKELQTNSLADYLGRTAESLKNGQTLSIIVVLLAVVLLGSWAWSKFRSSGQSSDAQLWTKLDVAINQEQLEQFAEANPGTTQARTARFELARYYIQQGAEKLGNPHQHKEGVKDLMKARALYQDLAPLCRSEPLLQQEALMGIARAEESLVGAADPTNAKQPAGSIDKAITYYEELAQKYPESFQGKAAKQRAQDLKANKQQIERFYTGLNQAAK